MRMELIIEYKSASLEPPHEGVVWYSQLKGTNDYAASINEWQMYEYWDERYRSACGLFDIPYNKETLQFIETDTLMIKI